MEMAETASKSRTRAQSEPPSAPGEDDEGLSMPEEKQVLRSNFKETAFFYPELKTDSLGNSEFSFDVPDALTKWKLQLLAHSKDLKIVE